MQKAGGGKASRFTRRLEGGAGESPPVASTPRASEAPSGARDTGKPKKTIRTTVDLPPDEHRFLRILAARSRSDGMRVMRTLLREAAEDEDLATRIEERLLAEAE